MEPVDHGAMYKSGFVNEKPVNSSLSKLAITDSSTRDSAHLSLVNSLSKLL